MLNIHSIYGINQCQQGVEGLCSISINKIRLNRVYLKRQLNKYWKNSKLKRLRY